MARDRAEARPVPPRHVYRWDLDKTYLKTEFDTVRDLVRSAFEKAEAKQSVPGAAALLRELKQGEGARICFISGSPRQMRKVLTRKLQLDGVEFDEFILKPNLRNIFRGRFRALRDQVGYKLPALLAGRSGLSESTRETCFGDDAEADAFVYSLYADLIAGRINQSLLARILELARVYPDDAARTQTLADSLSRADAVSRVFIHLDLRSPTARFDRYGPRLVPIYNYFQAALALFEDGLLDEEGVARVVLEMVERFGYGVDALRNSFEDLIRRGRVRGKPLEGLVARLRDGRRPAGWLPRTPAGSAPIDPHAVLSALGTRVGGLERTAPPTPPDDRPIDYLAAFADDVPRRPLRRPSLDLFE